MTKFPTVISGAYFDDHRGRLSVFNDFDMSQVKRFYSIENSGIDVKRAWRAHKIEQRWFNASNGTFKIVILPITDWEIPDPTVEKMTFILTANEPIVLHVPAGYATAIQALSFGAKLTVFADYLIENAIKDNYLYPDDYFGDW